MLSYKETLGYRRDLVEQVDSLSFFGIPFLSCYHHDLADSLDKQKIIDVDEAATYSHFSDLLIARNLMSTKCTFA